MPMDVFVVIEKSNVICNECNMCSLSLSATRCTGMLQSHCCKEERVIGVRPGMIFLLYEEIWEVPSSDSCSSAKKKLKKKKKKVY